MKISEMKIYFIFFLLYIGFFVATVLGRLSIFVIVVA